MGRWWNQIAAGAALLVAVPTGAAPPPPHHNDPQLIAAILTVHNRERATHGSPPLAWSSALAAEAADHAANLTRIGRMQHSPRAQRPGQGENLWYGTRGAFPVESMVTNWVGERRLFRPGAFPDNSQNGNWADVGHFTQLIWPTTTQVGCAIGRSAQWDFLVCRYTPAGNRDGVWLPAR